MIRTSGRICDLSENGRATANDLGPDLLPPLPRAFYDRDAEAVARDLLGTLLAHRVGDELRVGRVVETEAYLGLHDLAAHSSRGRTARTEVMFGPPGHAYVYLIYGMHHCLNAVTGPEGDASAVLIRALEPVRNVDGGTNGPGRLCRALAIDRTLNGRDLVGGDLFFSAPDDPSPSGSSPGPASASTTRANGRGSRCGFTSRGTGSSRNDKAAAPRSIPDVPPVGDPPTDLVDDVAVGDGRPARSEARCGPWRRRRPAGRRPRRIGRWRAAGCSTGSTSRPHFNQGAHQENGPSPGPLRPPLRGVTPRSNCPLGPTTIPQPGSPSE